MSRVPRRAGARRIRVGPLASLPVALLGVAPLLLRRMRRDLSEDGKLRKSTAALMWTAYGTTRRSSPPR